MVLSTSSYGNSELLVSTSSDRYRFSCILIYNKYVIHDAPEDPPQRLALVCQILWLSSTQEIYRT